MRNPNVEAYVAATANQTIAPSARTDVLEALRQVGKKAHFAEAQGLQVLALRRYLRMQNRGLRRHERGQLIAGTVTARIGTDWTAAGWATKLAEAVKQTQLRGPLQTPYEPWHWRIA
jgi:hypothetical protein